ncbi:hypothetical protein HYPDE_37358 [Hyphomicrobium denitrificans 1NES1]|uniref:Uncharacterized protein n=1 Tax=Hyphomicrobium denitrificans 1NES1 TaxID=670307 RepID=N0B7Z9_9HYPH|nr:hypothetical protein [Hyphomicrobium denitrificans]AGK59143.1 hypothetical protein HYPDE_37358 [Hyphomicrobium denitrificans 1NES1]
MRRPFSIFLIAVGSALLTLTGVARADGFTTRIVTQPYYGAVTTLEHGVRVIRPLPPDRYVIVNPNRTPLALSFSENNVYDYSSNAADSTYNGRSDLGAYNPDGPIYTYPSYGRRFFRGQRGFHHFRNGHPGKFGRGPHGKGSPGAIGLH